MTEKTVNPGKRGNIAKNGKQNGKGIQSALSTEAAREAAEQERTQNNIRRSEEELLKSPSRERWRGLKQRLTQNWMVPPLFLMVWASACVFLCLGQGKMPWQSITRDSVISFLVLGFFLLAHTYSLALLRFIKSGQWRQMLLASILLTLHFASLCMANHVITSKMQGTDLGIQLSALPLALLPAVTANLFDRRFAGVTALFQAMLLPLQTTIDPDNRYKLFYFALFIALVAIPCFQKVKRRMDFLTSGFYLGLLIFMAEIFYLITDTSMQFSSQSTWQSIMALLFASIANGLGTGILCIVILPIFESLFNISTPLSIAELTDIDTPLLQRLREAAPGTYAHSLAVADLAANAATAVGANGKLTFAMALYHDIGKLYAPGYFAENLRNGINPHDNIPAAESRDIILEHVKFGYELAHKNYHLSPLLYPAILQHHGNSLLSSFYHKACQEAQAKGLPPPAQDSYRYQQSLPSSTEVAIISLADGCEAGVRALMSQQPHLNDVAQKAADAISQDTTATKAANIQNKIAEVLKQELQQPQQEMSLAIEERIRSIIFDRIKDGQLALSPLTMQDIAIIAGSFLNTIVSKSHARPEYLR